MGVNCLRNTSFVMLPLYCLLIFPYILKNLKEICFINLYNLATETETITRRLPRKLVSNSFESKNCKYEQSAPKQPDFIYKGTLGFIPSQMYNST